MATNYQLGGWYDNPATGKNQRWWNGVWTDGEDPTQGQAPAPTSPTPAPAQNSFSTANVATQGTSAPAQNTEQTLINAMTQKGHTPESAKAAIAGRGVSDLSREYLGTSTTTGATGMVTNQPTINLPEIYKGLYQSSGVSNKEQELATKAQQLAEAKAKINDNPFLSEATRVGRIAKLDSLYNDQVAGLQNEIAMKKADIETQMNLQTKQFDIQSQQAQQAIAQFNSLLSSGALDNASGSDIANITAATGISSDMILSAVNNRKQANLTTTTQTFDDGKDEGFIIYTLDQSGNVVNEVRKVTGKSTKANSTLQYSTDSFVNQYVTSMINANKNSTNTNSGASGAAAAAGAFIGSQGLSDISTLW